MRNAPSRCAEMNGCRVVKKEGKDEASLRPKFREFMTPCVMQGSVRRRVNNAWVAW